MVDLSALLSNLSVSTLHLWQQPVSAAPPALKSTRQLQRQVRLINERILQLIDQHESGHSVRQLATEFNIHRDTVHEHLKRSGVPQRPNRRKMTDEQVTKAAELYAAHLSLVKVAAHFGVDAATIRREFAVAGVAVRPRRGWNNH